MIHNSVWSKDSLQTFKINIHSYEKRTNYFEVVPYPGIIGVILCAGEQNGGWVPVNKNLWSISYVMVTSCFAFALLSFLYVVIDVKHWWKGQPFFYPGKGECACF